jgi:hypothetical protein
MLVCCFRTQLNVNGARTLLFGRARSAYCNKTQSMHVDDLFLLMEECFCAFSEWSDAQEAPSKKGTAASIDRHPEATPSRHPDNVDIHYGFALARVCRSCIRLQARASQHFLTFSSSSSIFRVIASVPAGSRTSPRLHSLCNNDIGIIHVVTGVPASTTGPRLQPFGSDGN